MVEGRFAASWVHASQWRIPDDSHFLLTSFFPASQTDLVLLVSPGRILGGWLIFRQA